MIKCKICGHETKYKLTRHIQECHKMNPIDYKSIHGEYMTQEYRDKVSGKTKEKWKDKDYREKTNEARNKSWTPEKRERQKIILQNYYETSGNSSWNNGLTKENDDRLKSIGEKNKVNLLGRTKETFAYLQKHSDKMKALWKGQSKMTYPDKCLGKSEKQAWKSKISETISKKMANGEITNSCNRYKKGYYESNGVNYFYQSDLELKTMEFFDFNKIKWTNKHGIRIPYIDEHGSNRLYVPDFLVTIGESDYVIEMKGWKTKEVEIKSEFAKKIYGEKYNICYTMIELKEKINDIVKNIKNK